MFRCAAAPVAVNVVYCCVGDPAVVIGMAGAVPQSAVPLTGRGHWHDRCSFRLRRHWCHRHRQSTLSCKRCRRCACAQCCKLVLTQIQPIVLHCIHSTLMQLVTRPYISDRCTCRTAHLHLQRQNREEESQYNRREVDLRTPIANKMHVPTCAEHSHVSP